MRVFEKRLNNKAGFTRNQTDKITNFIDGIFTRFARLETSNLYKKYSIKVSVHRNCCAYFPAKKVKLGGLRTNGFGTLLCFLSNFLIIPTLIVLILYLPGLYQVVETLKLVE